MRRLAIAVVAALSACTSYDDVRDAPADEGFERAYSVPYTRALAAVRDGLADEGYVIRESRTIDSNTWGLMALQRADAGSTGRHTRVVVFRTPKRMVIRIFTKSRLGSRARAISDGDAATALHAAIARHLE